jgi:hypothetical protein
VEAAGRTLASVTLAACHPTCRGGALIGGDYPGFLCRELERATGGVALFVLGCAGDVRPRFTTPEGAFRQATLEEVEASGGAMAAAVLDRRAQRQALDPESIEVRGRFVGVPLLAPLGREALEEIVREESAPLRRQWALQMLNGRSALLDEIEFELQAVLLPPDALLLFWPGEIVADYALWLRNELSRRGMAKAMVGAYANGAVGYVPSARIYPEGGYEVTGSYPFYNLPAAYAPEVESILRGATLELLEMAPDGTKAGVIH